MKKILAVIRVSTETQETESQKNELVNFILSLGKYQENEIEFIEVAGASAVKMNEKYLQMLQSIKNKITESDTIRSVAFWHLNRLGRNEKAIVDMKVWFIENHIQVFVKNPSLTLLDSEGNVDNGANIAWGVFAAMVAYDTKEIKEKTLRGRRRNAESGKVQSGNALFGYGKDKDGYIIVDEEGGSAEAVRQIFTKYSNGESTLSIYRELSEKGMISKKMDDFIGKRCINNILSNVSYCGRVRNGKKVSEGKNEGKEYNKTTTHYPPIISEETFDKVAELRKSRQYEKQETANVYFGKSIIKYTDNTLTETLVPARATAVYKGRRSHLTININVVDAILWNEAKREKLLSIATQSVEHREKVERHLSDCEIKIKTAKEIITDYENTLERVNDLYIEGKLTKERYEKKYNDILDKLSGEKARLEQVRRQRVSLVAQLEHIAKDEHIAVISDVECISATDSEKAAIVREMISKVVIRRDGDDRFITLYDSEGVECVNTYIYRREGSRSILSVNNGKETKPINTKTFVVKRFARKKYA